MKSFIVAVLVTAGMLYAKEGDPGGWQKAKWGMTAALIQKAYGGTIPTETEIGAFKYAVRLGYDGKGKLQEVDLSAIEKDGLSVYYTDAVGKLKAKYGAPETEESDLKDIMNQRGQAVWLFKKTKITVKFFQSIYGGVESKLLYIRYQKSGMVEKGSENL